MPVLDLIDQHVRIVGVVVITDRPGIGGRGGGHAVEVCCQDS